MFVNLDRFDNYNNQVTKYAQHLYFTSVLRKMGFPDVKPSAVCAVKIPDPIIENHAEWLEWFIESKSADANDPQLSDDPDVLKFADEMKRLIFTITTGFGSDVREIPADKLKYDDPVFYFYSILDKLATKIHPTCQRKLSCAIWFVETVKQCMHDYVLPYSVELFKQHLPDIRQLLGDERIDKILEEKYEAK